MYANGHSPTPELAIDVPWVVGIGASAGGIEGLLQLLPALPASLPAAIVIAQHLGPSDIYRSRLAEMLRVRSALPVQWAEHGQPLCRGNVYVLPQSQMGSVTLSGTIRLEDAPQRPCPSVDHLFESIAQAWRARAVGVILSGCLRDGARGAQHISKCGGVVLAQDRSTASYFDMPGATLGGGANPLMLPARAIAHALVTLLMARGARSWFQVKTSSAYLATT